MNVDYKKLLEIQDFHSFGRYKGRLWMLRYGFERKPCGYVLLTDKESERYPGFADYDKVDKDIQMHGGCTYLDTFEPCEYRFIGFDCCHHEDYADPKTFKFAECECKKIIDQLIAMEGDK